jgi:hypothetical protein
MPVETQSKLLVCKLGTAINGCFLELLGKLKSSEIMWEFFFSERNSKNPPACSSYLEEGTSGLL